MVRKNQTEVATNFAIIKLTDGYTAIVDPEDFEDLNKYYWRAIRSHNCIYAMRRTERGGRVWHIRMHRQIAETPRNMVCHHKNHKSLDNRKQNLENMDKDQHHYLHGKTRCSFR